MSAEYNPTPSYDENEVFSKLCQTRLSIPFRNHIKASVYI